jgi:hypothetical protein
MQENFWAGSRRSHGESVVWLAAGARAAAACRLVGGMAARVTTLTTLACNMSGPESSWLVGPGGWAIHSSLSDLNLQLASETPTVAAKTADGAREQSCFRTLACCEQTYSRARQLQDLGLLAKQTTVNGNV